MPVGRPYDPYLLPSFGGIYHAQDMGYARALGYEGLHRSHFGGYHQRRDPNPNGFEKPTSMYRDGVPLLAGANVYPAAKYDSAERRR